MQVMELCLESGAPDWFEKLVEEDADFGIDFASGLDHARQFGDIALFATYSRECEALLPVINFCRKAGLVVHIGGKSFYSPRTTAVAIYRREDEPQFRYFQDSNIEFEEF